MPTLLPIERPVRVAMVGIGRIFELTSRAYVVARTPRWLLSVTAPMTGSMK